MSGWRDVLALAVIGLPVLGGLLLLLPASAARQDVLNRVLAAIAGGLALVASALAVWAGYAPQAGSWFGLDALGAPFLAVIGLVGMCSGLVSPAYLRTSHGSFFRAERARRMYYLSLYLFWAALLAIPLAANLAVAWVLIEVTTGVSALLVAYSGRRSALEAGWKYLVITTAGLTVALLGLVVLYAASPDSARGVARLSWTVLASHAGDMSPAGALTGFLLLLAGLATKVGWAPVHNWLPDAHSEAPPPVSALLSAALLPAVMLVAWRAQRALLPAVGASTARGVFLGFGLASLAVAVPFLWRPLAWKRLLAYSSLEHMGVLALGIGFGGPLALAGVLIHLSGHAVAKSLGFYAATPLFELRPSARIRPVRGLLRQDRTLAAGMSLSLASLSGLPPSPLFFSEVLILMGGFVSGHAWPAAVAALLLALGFLGLAHVLVQDLLSTQGAKRMYPPRPASAIGVLTAGATALLLALAVAALYLPGSDLVQKLLEVSP